MYRIKGSTYKNKESQGLKFCNFILLILKYSFDKGMNVMFSQKKNCQKVFGGGKKDFVGTSVSNAD